MKVINLILVFALYDNTFSDALFLKNGQHTETEIIDTTGCEVLYVRNNKKTRIKKKHLDFIIFSNDTIKYADYDCLTPQKSLVQKSTLTQRPKNNNIKENTVHIGDMANDNPSEKDGIKKTIFIPEIWNPIASGVWKYIKGEIRENDANLLFLNKIVAGGISSSEPLELALSEFSRNLKEYLNVKTISEKDIPNILKSNRDNPKYLIFIYEVIEDLYHSNYPNDFTGGNTAINPGGGLTFGFSAGKRYAKRARVKITFSILNVNTKTIIYKKTHENSRSYSKWPKLHQCYEDNFFKARNALGKYLGKY